MSDVLVAPSTCCKRLLAGKWWKQKLLPPTRWQCGILSSQSISKLKPPMIIKAQMASFDHYLEDKPRVFRAIFPEKQRSQQLNEEEWRINMLPIDFLFLTVKPEIDMRVRCKSKGIKYPPEVPNDITKIIELEIIRWELQGLDDVLKPSHFSLRVKGVIYPDRRGPRTRLRGRLQMTISFILPAVLSLIPEEVRREVAESVLRRLMENMKSKVNGSLLADYSTFKREKFISLV